MCGVWFVLRPHPLNKGFRDGNSIEFFIYDNGHHVVRYTKAGSFNGEWHHVAGTYDGQQLKLYIDGQLEQTSAHVGSIAKTSAAVNIGRNADHIFRFYEGLIADVRIYNAALDDFDISRLAGR